MSPRVCLSLGAWLAGLAVVLGAFGAHLLKGHLHAKHRAERADELLANWDTGVRYQMYSSLGLIAAGLWTGQRAGRRPTGIAAAQVTGILLFSGFLYAHTLLDQKWLGMVIPIGGLAMIAGWLLFAWQVLWEKGLDKGTQSSAA